MYNVSMIPLPNIARSYAGYYGETFEKFLELIVSDGFTAAQLIPDQAPNLYSSFDHDRIENLSRFISRNNLQIHIHNVFYDINLVSLVPDVQDNSFRITEKVLEFAKNVGATTLTVHPGYIFPGWRNDPIQNAQFWQSADHAMERLSKLSMQSGIKIFIENGSYFLTTATSNKKTPLHAGISADEVDRLLSSASGVELCLDIGKVKASGEDPSLFFTRFADRIGQLQIADWEMVEQLEQSITALIRKDPNFSVVFEGPRHGLKQALPS